MDEQLSTIHSLPKERWPERLLEIPQPPTELWISGTLPDTAWTWLTVVGSRKATEYGKACCTSLIQSLSGLPVVLVSGLALGIDATAHEAALGVSLPCVAVPGSGLHHSVLAPAQNHKLATRIVHAGGCLISPFPPTYPAAPFTFPTRNRIMAGLSHAVLIIEATEKSGTLITARMAVDYNRDVGIVPGSIFAPGSRGPHQFLALGATPIFDASSLHTFLGFNTPMNAHDSDSNVHGNHPRDTQTSLFTTNTHHTFTQNEQQLLAAITESNNKHTLSLRTRLPQSIINETLTLLEIKKVITITGSVVERFR